jgi:hypothetical protein
MSGLFRRLSSRRSAGPDGVEPAAQAEPGATDAPTNAPAEPGGQPSLLTDPAAPREDEQQTRVLGEGSEPAQPEATPPAAAAEAPRERPLGELAPVIPPVAAEAPPLPASDLPAGLDPDELLAAPPSSARRGRLRRRVAFLRAAREVLLRDLGGFAYEIHRTASDVEHEAHRRLREIKLARLTRLDAELHGLELRLDDVRRHVVVREPGVGGECPQCGELFGSDANYCAHCGVPLTDAARKAIAREAAAAQLPPEAQPVPAGQQTEEFTPSAETEFHWPRRAGEAAAAPTAGEVATTGDDPPTVVERPVTPAGEASTGDEPPTGDEPSAAVEQSATTGEDAPTAVERPATPADETPAGDAATGDEPPTAAEEPAPTAIDEPVTSDDAPTAVEQPASTGREGSDEAADQAASGDETADGRDAKDSAAGGDGLNGRDSAYRAVEPRS